MPGVRVSPYCTFQNDAFAQVEVIREESDDLLIIVQSSWNAARLQRYAICRGVDGRSWLRVTS